MHRIKRLFKPKKDHMLVFFYFPENKMTLRENKLAHHSLMGSYITRLMRAKKVTIRGLAEYMNVTMIRVREVRALEVQGECFCRDWLEAIDNCGKA